VLYAEGFLVNDERLEEGELPIGGSAIKIIVNAFEGTRIARDLCIAHHGSPCFCYLNYDRASI